MGISFLEAVSYFFFKRRLRKKLHSLYEMEDPWSSRELSAFFAPLIRAQMQKLPAEIRNAPLLDAGGGEGHFYSPLRDIIPNYHLLDIDATALRRAREFLKNQPCHFIHQNLDVFSPPPDTYGVIWLFSLLTYLGESRHPRIFRSILEKLWRSLKKQGMVLLIHPYYSEGERKLLSQYGELFLAFGGQLILSHDDKLGSQSFLIQGIRKL